MNQRLLMQCNACRKHFSSTKTYYAHQAQCSEFIVPKTISHRKIIREVPNSLVSESYSKSLRFVKGLRVIGNILDTEPALIKCVKGLTQSGLTVVPNPIKCVKQIRVVPNSLVVQPDPKSVKCVKGLKVVSKSLVSESETKAIKCVKVVQKFLKSDPYPKYEVIPIDGKKFGTEKNHDQIGCALCEFKSVKKELALRNLEFYSHMKYFHKKFVQVRQYQTIGFLKKPF